MCFASNFEFAVKWLPIDYWCDTDLDAIKQVIEAQVLPQIQTTDSWAMIVKKRRWQRYHSAEIIAHLAPSINRKVNLNNPDKIIWIDILGPYTVIAVVKPEQIFSAIQEC